MAKVTARTPIQPLSSMPSAWSSQSSVKHDASIGDDNEQASKGDEDPQMSLFHQVSEWLQHEKVDTRTARLVELRQPLVPRTLLVSPKIFDR